jgi:SAM-dependent methyltransferase
MSARSDSSIGSPTDSYQPAEDRYERLAGLELLRRRSGIALEPDLAIHRRLSVPQNWLTANKGVPKSNHLYDLIVTPLRLPQSPHILDAGCGFGAGLVRLLALTGGTGIGITPSPRQRAVAESLAIRHGLASRSRFLPVAMDRTVGTFDLIVAVESLTYVPDFEAAARNLARQLNPGGYLIVVDDFWQRAPDHHLSPAAKSVIRAGWQIEDFLTVGAISRALPRTVVHESSVDLGGKVILAPKLARTAVKALSRLGHRLPVGSTARILADFLQAQMLLQDSMATGALTYSSITFRRE